MMCWRRKCFTAVVVVVVGAVAAIDDGLRGDGGRGLGEGNNEKSARPASASGPTAPSSAGRGEPELTRWVDQAYPSLESLYRHLHAHPELSYQEKATSARIAEELRQAGLEVTNGVGGYGVVGVLRNGAGPTVLIRTDLDALPVSEATGLAYASGGRTSGENGARG